MERAGLVVLICLLCLVGMIPMAAEGDTTPSECKREKDLLVGACKRVVVGLEPSAACCQRVLVTHAECVCPYLSPKVANLINVNRSIRQIQRCGRTVPHNFKCGSVTTP
ncbi:uncharacterized protein LOC126803071 [Argentina anserina]|uniref:uncharacterized protein LOC126803071 n=1 Tax=Argentina anserina TaxID=57926 RepID=UPI0021766609|nr:uncharacterized protein LOC126803071 [Potentilla anserina]